MAKEMLINVSEGEECRIALLEDEKLEELYMERHSATSHVGNIYKGKVTNVEASIQAAFVDFGLGRNGFLHISDLMPTYFGRQGEDVHETVGRKLSRRDRPPIQRCLRRGDEIIVQIIKEGIGTKGPTLTTYLSIPGRILVMMPGMGKMGVSKKIEDDVERRRLRQILDGLKPPKDVGFIIRTAGIDRSKLEIERDLKYLTRLWENIEKKLQSGKGPMELYTEGDLITRTVRDVFTNEIDRIVVDNKDVAKRIKEFIKITAPRTKNRVETYEELVPLFHKYGIEKEIEEMYSRHVPLPSGGSLVIDSTEAVVAIDVNSGKFREHNDAEQTAFRTDMEAADEIPRQLKLRDLGGVIICDFIDLRFERNRRELEERLHENLKRDRAKTKVLRMSQFGIIEMTRQRMRPSLKRSIYSDCPHCKGAGLVKTHESMALDVMRRLAIAVNDLKIVRVELTVCTEVAYYLQNKKRSQLASLETNTKKQIVIKSDSTFGLDEVKFDLFDSRDGFVMLDGLNAVPAAQPSFGNRGGRGRGGRPQLPGRQQHDHRGPAPANRQLPAPKNQDEDDDEDRFDMDSVEAAVDDREERQESGAAEVDAALVVPLGEGESAEPGTELAKASPAAAAKAPAAKSGRAPAKGRGRAAAKPPVVKEQTEEEDQDDIEGVDDPTAGGSELLSRDNGAVGEDDDYRNRNRRGGRRGGRGGRGPDNRGGDNRNANQRGDQRNAGPRDSEDRASASAEGEHDSDEHDSNEHVGEQAGEHGERHVGEQSSPQGRQDNRGQPQRNNNRQPQRNDRQPQRNDGRNDGRNEGRNDGRVQPQRGGGRNDNRNQQPRGDGRNSQGRNDQGRNDGRNNNNNPGRPNRQPPAGQQRRPQPQLPRLSADDAFRNVDESAHEPNGNLAPREDELEEEVLPQVSGNQADGQPTEDGEDRPRRRRRRGGRRHRRRRENAEARLAGTPGEPGNESPNSEGELIDEEHSGEEGGEEPVIEGETADADEPQQKSLPPKAERAPRELPPQEPIVRTGSSDKHYVHTEVPVDPEPVRRPKSYRDLDAIPDDLD